MALGVEEEILDGNEGTGRNYRNMETEEMATRHKVAFHIL